MSIVAKRWRRALSLAKNSRNSLSLLVVFTVLHLTPAANVGLHPSVDYRELRADERAGIETNKACGSGIGQFFGFKAAMKRTRMNLLPIRTYLWTRLNLVREDDRPRAESKQIGGRR
jgi:hypothetical protein